MLTVYVPFCITPDDELIDLKHVKKCKECKHLGTHKKQLCVLKV
jgi:hypothetical protein